MTEICSVDNQVSDGELIPHVLSNRSSKTRNLLTYESTRKLIWKICRHLLRDAKRATQRRQFVRRISPELVVELSEDAEGIGYLYEDMVQGALALINAAVNGLIADVKIVQDQLEFSVLPSKGADVKEFCYKVIKLAREVDQYSNIDCVLVSSKGLSEIKRQDFLTQAPELTPYQADKIAEVLLTLPQEVVAQFQQFHTVIVRKRMQDNDSVAIVCLTDANEYAYLLIAIPLNNFDSGNRRGPVQQGFSEGLQEASLIHLLKDMRDELWGQKQFALFIVPSLLQKNGTLLLFDELDKQMIEAFKITQFTLELPKEKTHDFEQWIFNISFDDQDPNRPRNAIQVKDKMAMWGVVLAGSAAGSLLGFKANPTYGTVAGAVLGGVAGFQLYKALQR